MPIKLPVEIAYFYEISQVTDRLLYCIPKEQLQSMVEQGKVQENILDDYPDGVDIKVSPIQFKEFHDNYGLNFDMDPKIIWEAFQFVKSKMEKKYFGTGFIQKKYLEDVTKQIKSDYDQIISEPEKIDLSPAAIKKQKRIQQEMRLSKRRLDKKLKRLPLKDMDSNKSIKEQSFTQVKMSKGDEPFYFLSRYNHKTKKGKRNARSIK